MGSLRPARKRRPWVEAHGIPTLTGPTGVGKTDLSIALARLLNAEIISVDSRQIYRELTIGSAKPDRDQLESVPHHFICELSLDQPCSSGRFAAAARRRMTEILDRGRTPLLVGGSTLYLQAIQFGLAEIPAIKPNIRAHLMARLEEHGADRLYQELADIDPPSAAGMDPTKTQRLVRALEVYYATGRPLSSFHASQENSPPPLRFRTIVLHRERKELYQRIDWRVDEMLRRGLIDEVRAILGAGFDPRLNALRTIGYREAVAHIQGALSIKALRETVKRNTRRYAKRQITWFKRFPEYHWIRGDIRPEALLEAFSTSESVPAPEDA